MPTVGSEQAGGRPVIYCFIDLPEVGGGGRVVAMSQAGRILAEDYGRTAHACRVAIGLGGFNHHTSYGYHYPNGYVLTWVEDPRTDAELRRVIEVNRRISEIEEAL